LTSSLLQGRSQRFIDAVSSQKTLEWNFEAMAVDELRKLFHPSFLEAEDIVGEPEMIWRIFVPQADHFRDDIGRASGMISSAEDRLGAPVATIRAAPAGYQVGRKVSVVFDPEVAVSFHV